MNKAKYCISTIAPDADTVARKYGLGLEIAEYCTAWNMDDKFEETNPVVREKLTGIENRVLHAPFNELFPCSIQNERFITSGMKRTNETLRVLFGDVPFEVDSRFREEDFGIFEIHSHEDLKDMPLYQEWLTGDNGANIPPNGEKKLLHQSKQVE